MSRIKVECFYALGMTAILFSPQALTNGINPPPPSETIINASCTPRNQSQEINVLRAKIQDDGGFYWSLKIRKAGALEDVNLADIRTIRFSWHHPDINGYSSATLTRWNNGETETVFVQTRSRRQNISLVGYSNNGLPIKIELTACSALSFHSSRQPFNSMNMSPAPAKK